jgi:hypothetical protein
MRCAIILVEEKVVYVFFVACILPAFQEIYSLKEFLLHKIIFPIFTTILFAF